MRTAVYRWFERHRWAGDAILGGLLLIALLVNASQFSGRRAAALLVLSALPMFLRRSRPEAALLLSIGLLGVNLLVLSESTVAVVLAPVMVHAATAYAAQRFWGRLALVAGLAGSLLAPVQWGYVQRDDLTLGAMAVGLCAVSVLAAFVLGERQRDRTEHQAEQVRALSERVALQAAERDQRVRIAAATERTRIARELHDIVAHSLSVIIVQADGAAAAVAARPELAESVLRTIGDTSREALAEMRQLVGVLRSGPDDRPVDYAPAQGLADLPGLIEQVRAAGIPVEYLTTGPVATLPAGLELTVYRLVQEALTNVIKHAGPAVSARVEIEHRADRFRVTVTDDGRGAAAGAPDATSANGHGLVGMRERVALQRGRLEVGPRVGGGFGVRATFPLQAKGGNR